MALQVVLPGLVSDMGYPQPFSDKLDWLSVSLMRGKNGEISEFSLFEKKEV